MEKHSIIIKTTITSGSDRTYKEEIFEVSEEHLKKIHEKLNKLAEQKEAFKKTLIQRYENLNKQKYD